MDKKQEYEIRIRQCLEAAKPVVAEAKRDGLAVEAKLYLDIGGEPKVTVAVLMR